MFCTTLSIDAMSRIFRDGREGRVRGFSSEGSVDGEGKPRSAQHLRERKLFGSRFLALAQLVGDGKQADGLAVETILEKAWDWISCAEWEGACLPDPHEPWTVSLSQTGGEITARFTRPAERYKRYIHVTFKL